MTFDLSDIDWEYHLIWKHFRMEESTLDFLKREAGVYIDCEGFH